MISVEDLVFVGLTALLHAWQLGMAATEVAQLRTKYNIKAPETTGPPAFTRALRAQQNSLEFGVAFQIVLWLTGIFCHQVPAVVFGLMYIYGRHQYIKGYIQEADKRIPGFWTSINALKGLFAAGMVGMANILLKSYAGLDVTSLVLDKFYLR